jgi:tetratricopeptide (TPR) repeat protein
VATRAAESSTPVRDEKRCPRGRVPSEERAEPRRRVALRYYETSVPRGLRGLHARPWVYPLLLGSLFSYRALAKAGSDASAALERAISAAETSLQKGEYRAAESHYRSALFEGWLLLGTLERIEGKLPRAREAFESASAYAVENRSALQALALVHLQMGEAAKATEVLAPLARRNPKDIQTRRLLAQALVANAQPGQAAKELEEARAVAPDDLELAFAEAGAYLGLKKPDLAARLFAQIVAARPLPQTHVLIGRTYRDFGEYERARAELKAALKLDPRVRRAHYYLGNMIVREKGMAGLEDAIPEFQAELKLAPQDALANLELGIALVDTQRPEDALLPLGIAARSDPPQARTLYYLGRAQLGVDRQAEAVRSLRRALELVEQHGAEADQLRVIHNQLGQALSRLGQGQEAATHFAEAERLSAKGSDAAREQMARYQADNPEPEATPGSAAPLIETSPLAALAPSERVELKRRVASGLARSYLNLGVMQAQGEHFAEAAELLEKAAGVDPDFPRVQYSLGVAHFNAQQFEKATGPLTRALALSPQDAGLKRMLAMAWLNAEKYEKAAELLRDDPDLPVNPSLQFAYGLALAKSERTAEAEAIFSRLLALHGDSPELNVLLGKAHAQMGEFDSAVESLQRALRFKADVAEANGTLGVIYLKQGRMAEAEKALRAELAAHPTDLQSQQNLAVVLESLQQPDAAIPILRSALKAKPDFADARYLLGKILLAEGAAAEAVEHLEAAARVAPEDAKIHYQLGRAYQKLGRTELSERELEIYRHLKDKRPGSAP